MEGLEPQDQTEVGGERILPLLVELGLSDEAREQTLRWRRRMTQTMRLTDLAVVAGVPRRGSEMAWRQRGQPQKGVKQRPEEAGARWLWWVRLEWMFGRAVVAASRQTGGAGSQARKRWQAGRRAWTTQTWSQ